MVIDHDILLQKINEPVEKKGNRRVRQDFSTTNEESIGPIFQPCETGYYIRAPREQNAIKKIRLSHRITLRILLMR